MDGEHKQATVLDCRLDTASLTEQLDAEGVLDGLHYLLAEAAEEVGRYAGSISSVLGDGLVALFGVPVAHEDHARRAVLAALGIQRRLEQPLSLGADPRGQRSVRLGEHLRIVLHTGWVVVARIGPPPDQRTTAVGETTSLAANLLRAAAPGTIVVSQATARIVGGFARLQQVRSIAVAREEIVVHRLTGVRPRRSPLAGLESRTLSPFVGRDRELTILHDALSQVVETPHATARTQLSRFVGRSDDLQVLQGLFTKGEAGQGQVVGVVGEPGMGKSRLVYEFRRSLGTNRITYLEGRCASYATTTPYLPILDVVRANCGIQDTDEPATIVDKVRFGLREVDLDPDQHAGYVLHMLGLAEGAAAVGGLGPDIVKARTFDTLRTWTLAGSRQRPIIVAVEDLHWIDRSSEEYLSTLVDSIAGAPVLLLCSWRPGYRPPWRDHSYVTQLSLRALSPRDSVIVVERIVATEHLAPSLVQSLVQRAEGNPFFLEELARVVVDHRERDPDRAIPDTIQGVLAARMDRLPDTPRRVLQTVSVIGREFSLRLLHAILRDPIPPEDALQELERQEFIYERSERSLTREPVYVFKHALTQEAAYASLTRSRRRHLHEQIGRMLAAQFPEVADTQPELLAHHFTQAGMGATAIDYWQRAGERAAERSANVEAISHFRAALQLLPELPPSAERTRRELALQIALGGPLIATHGYGAAETVAAYTRALELAEGVSDPDLLFPLLYRRWVTHNIWAQHAVARDAARHFLELAERQPRSDLRMMGRRMLGITVLFCGELAAARGHLEQALELYDPAHDRALMHRYGQEPRASILAWLAVALCLLGSEQEAVRMVAEAIASARAIGHTNTLAYTLFYGGALVHQLRRDARAVAEYAEATAALARQHQLSMWAAYAGVALGWARAAERHDPQALPRMVAALAALEASGTGLLRPHLLGWLADAQARAGRPDDGLRTLSDALSLCARTGEGWCEARLRQLQVELSSQTT
jgi:class 3 adenylate cyclase